MATNTFTGTDGDYANTANWSLAAVPVATNDVVIKSGDITTGLSQGTVAINSFTVSSGYAGKIGTDAGGLQINTPAFDFSAANQVCYIEFVTTATTGEVYNTVSGTNTTQGLYLSGASMTRLDVYKGYVSLSAACGEVNVHYIDSKESDANVVLEAGYTVAVANQQGGKCEALGTVTTGNIYAGSFTTSGSATVTTLNNYGGKVISSGSGTVVTMNADGGEIDMLKGLATRTVTTLSVSSKAKVKYNPNIVTVTNAVASDGGILISSV